MEINISSIRILRNNPDYIRIAMRKPNSEYEQYETFFCVSKKEYIALVRDCMLGNTDVYPLFDDGLYALKFVPLGMKVFYSDRREVEYFQFPVKELVSTIDELFSDTDEGYDEVDLTEKIQQWQSTYGPKVILKIENDVFATLAWDEKSEWLEELPRMGLIESLTNWAKSYSNGNNVYVNIVFDTRRKDNRPCDYYWWLSADDCQRIVNGGWIAHANEWPVTETSKFKYSMHT